MLLISALYISQSVPVSFIKTGFQVFLKEQQLSYDSIGRWLGLMLLPWTFKFLWAPFVDRYRIGFLGGLGHRKSWIVLFQILGAFCLAVVAFLKPESQLMQIILLFFIYSFISATQDIAVDGLTVLTLSKKEHGAGNAMQMGGYYFGEMLGGAVILILFDLYGWTISIMALALFFLTPLLLVFSFKEPECPQPIEKESFLKSIHGYVKQEEWAWLLLLILYMGNQVLARALLPSILQEKGLSAGQIGSLISIWGNSVSVIGAITGGMIINRLGRKNALLIFGFIKLPAYLLILTLPGLETGHPLIYLTILSNDFFAGLATVALFTVMMDRCRLNHPGSDFTFQQSINSIGVLLFVILSGILKSAFGLEVLIYTAIIMGLLALMLVKFALNNRRLG